jgi:hypothetical protein
MNPFVTAKELSAPFVHGVLGIFGGVNILLLPGSLAGLGF